MTTPISKTAKTTNATTQSQELANQVLLTRKRVEIAESLYTKAKVQARDAKRKRQETKLIARSTKKLAKDAKVALAYVKSILADAEVKLAKSNERKNTVKKTQSPVAPLPKKEAAPLAKKKAAPRRKPVRKAVSPTPKTLPAKELPSQAVPQSSQESN